MKETETPSITHQDDYVSPGEKLVIIYWFKMFHVSETCQLQ